MGDANRRYHDRVASKYDAIYERDPYWNYYFDVSWADLKKSLPANRDLPVLDVGCGTGLYGLKLQALGFRVVYSDYSPRMLDRALWKARASFPETEPEGLVADITDLAPFDAEQFSLVVAQGDPLSFSTNFRKALKNIWRVLAPGGRAVLSVDSRFGAIDPFASRGDLAGLEAFLKTGNNLWLADRQEERFPFHAFLPSELRSASERVGFQVQGLIGKTILDLRGGHRWLGDVEDRKRLLKLEARYGASELAMGRAHHLQIRLEKSSRNPDSAPRGRNQKPRGPQGKDRS